MSKREIESLDESDLKEEHPRKPTKRERKSYSNCFHATKSGMRCLNISKHGFKIGFECYDFCKDHIDGALLKLFTILTGPIELSQHQIKGWKSIKFDTQFDLSIQCWNVEDTKQITEIYRTDDGRLGLAAESKIHSIHSSIDEIVQEMMPFLLREPNGFIVKIWVFTEDKIDFGYIKDKIYGRFKGDEIMIPVDDIQLTEPEEEDLDIMALIKIQVQLPK